MKRLLIVEDDYKYSFELKQLFTHDYIVDEVVDGLSAVAKVHLNRYEAVILDIEILGDVSGLEVLESIKNDAKIEKTVVVILTNSGPEKKEEFISKGADTYIVKSEISFPELKNVVDGLTSSGSKAQ